MSSRSWQRPRWTTRSPSCGQPTFGSARTARTVSWPGSTGSWLDFLKSIIPSNILGLGVSSRAGEGGAISSSLSFNVLQLVVLGIVVGAAALAVGKKADPFLSFNKSALEIASKLVWWVIKLSPIGTAALIGKAVATYKWEVLASLGIFTVDVYVGCAIVLPFLHPISEAMRALDSNPVRLVADFHTLFNVALAAVFIVPLPAVAKALEWLLPEPPVSRDAAAPLYLDAAAVGTPLLALTCAARETLHMGDLIEQMLRKTIDALMTDDRRLVAEIERTDNAVDKLHEAIKLYVTRITRESLDEGESRRAMEIVSFAINLEHIGDIIDKNLMELATKKIKNRFSFSESGAAELQDFHRRVLENLKLGFSVFMSGDIKMARHLIEEKIAIREAERIAAENHFARLREGVPATVETSSLHLDILRDLKRIHSHICSVAYPVLETTGELQPSRLKTADAAAARIANGRLAGEPMP